MARPRKNRLGEYARLLGEEIGVQLTRELSRAIAENQKAYQAEIAQLRAEIRNLERRIETLSSKTTRGVRARIGKWVPGGPGRPPKDAAARIAAFEARVRRVGVKTRRATQQRQGRRDGS
jgi:hypothetical protein